MTHWNPETRKHEEDICEECGAVHNRWNGWSREQAKYCSNACKQKAYRKRKNAIGKKHDRKETH